jgi:arginyl-tRNA synthetase
MHLESLLADRLSVAFAAVAGFPVDPAVRASRRAGRSETAGLAETVSPAVGAGLSDSAGVSGGPLLSGGAVPSRGAGGVAGWQSGAALALAGRLGRPARDIAAEVVARAEFDGLATATVSGPGFVNLTVTDEALAAAVEALDGDRLGVPATTKPERVVVDYSGPNLAKEMHVGHLRSTIIGDALARLLSWQGHEVIRVNHVGDWGTPFAMLIEHLADLEGEAAEHTLGDLTAFYRAARVRFDGDEGFRDRTRRRVVALQAGDGPTRALWRRLVAQSQSAFLGAYRRLGVTLGPADFAGESSYQDDLASVVAELDEQGLLVASGGALCVFPPGFTGRDGEPLPLIVRKSDGGYGYPATDLAAVRHRVRVLGATRLLYVVGTPQQVHFRMVFAVARAAGWLPDGVTAEHVDFGSILGPDGKMLRTRAGESLQLSALLDEAGRRASDPALGIGAIKYADLAGDRRSDYLFDWDRMLAATGNTGPYLQYAAARTRSLAQRQGGSGPGPVVLGHPAERRLALALLGFEPAVTAAADQREPHRLAAYLHNLSVAFSVFYERCPILRAGDTTRASRLTLADRTGRTLRLGLDLLGIEVPTRM